MNYIESCCKCLGRHAALTPILPVLLCGKVRKGGLTKCMGYATIRNKDINKTATECPFDGLDLCDTGSDTDATGDVQQVGKGNSDHAIIQGRGHKTAIGAIDGGQNVTDCPLFE